MVIKQRVREYVPRKYTTISIPVSLYRQIEELIKGTGFSSVSEFAVYVLREVVALKKQTRSGPELTQEELEQLRKKLEALGYL